MTVRLKPTTAPKRRHHTDSDDRQTFLVTVGFIALIVLVILVVLASAGIGYYNSHFKPIANVGNVAITRDEWGDQVNLEGYRLTEEEGQVRTQLAADPGNADKYNAILSDIASKQDTQTLADQSANDLLDLVFKEQLATQNGVTVSDADIQAEIAKDASTPEQRHVLAIEVAPQPLIAGADPDAKDKQVAYDNAQKAAAALAAGTPFSQVAAQYSTDPSKDKGGDLGFLLATDTTDTTWVDALFRLSLNGTTPVIKGDDGTYRIGMVTEIKPGVVDPDFTTGAIQAVGNSAYQTAMRRQAIADALDKKITDTALTTAVDQYKLAEIEVAINGADPSTDVQIHASHILYSPNHDPNNEASLPPTDPAWAAAKALADKTAADLNAITDIPTREARFAEIAKSESDDKTSGAAGGDLGTFTADAMVEQFATPLFGNPNLKPGDIVGPVQSDFGWHVILFQGRVPSADDRLTAVKAALAASGADFGAIAQQYSDGAQALQGGELGWQTAAQLQPDVATKVAAAAVGSVTDPIQEDSGFFIEKVEDKASRVPDADQAAVIAANAFTSWYTNQKNQATNPTDGSAPDIVTDKSVFTDSSSGSGQ